MPNPPHKPTEKQRQDVKNMAAVGITQEDIVKVIRVDLKTLRKHYRVELDESLVKANAQIGGALFAKAKGGDTSAIIWWEKTRAGKSDIARIDHTSNGDVLKIFNFDTIKPKDE